MHSYTDISIETLRSLDLSDLLSDRDLDLLRAAEAHHRTELYRELLATDDYGEQPWQAYQNETAR
jgi:hypothetical protein